jgi:glycosyltransferase involved in cell wall biosynthesis
VVPLICEIEPYRELPGPEAARGAFGEVDWSAPVLVYLSRLHYKKGPDKLIRAVGRLRREGRGVELLFAGTSETPEYERELRALSESEDARARFLGFVAGATKISLLQAADLVVIPTSQENFGFVFFEALAAGAALVTTKGTDTWPELLESGGTALTEADPEAIARTVAELLDDPERVRSMGEAGRRWAMATLEPSRVVEGFVAMYRDASGGGS